MLQWSFKIWRSKLGWQKKKKNLSCPTLCSECLAETLGRRLRASLYLSVTTTARGWRNNKDGESMKTGWQRVMEKCSMNGLERDRENTESTADDNLDMNGISIHFWDLSRNQIVVLCNPICFDDFQGCFNSRVWIYKKVWTWNENLIFLNHFQSIILSAPLLQAWWTALYAPKSGFISLNVN